MIISTNVNDEDESFELIEMLNQRNDKEQKDSTSIYVVNWIM